MCVTRLWMAKQFTRRRASWRRLSEWMASYGETKIHFLNWFVGKDWHDLDLCRHRQFTLATRVHADDRPLAIRVDVD